MGDIRTGPGAGLRENPTHLQGDFDRKREYFSTFQLLLIDCLQRLVRMYRNVTHPLTVALLLGMIDNKLRTLLVF